MVDDLKENLLVLLFLFSMVIVSGMLMLGVVGVLDVLNDPVLQTVWYINVGLLFLSYLLLCRLEGSKESWYPPLDLEPSPTPRGVVTRVTTSHAESSQRSEPRGPGIGGNIEAPLEPSPQVSLAELEDVEALGAHTLEQARLETLEHQSPTLEREALEQKQPLEQEETLEQSQALEQEKALEPLEPTKEELERLKEALGLDKGSLHYKKRGDGIYHVTYDSAAKKHRWTRLGSWPELRGKLTE